MISAANIQWGKSDRAQRALAELAAMEARVAVGSDAHDAIRYAQKVARGSTDERTVSAYGGYSLTQVARSLRAARAAVGAP